jgi:hypothetical protein
MYDVLARHRPEIGERKLISFPNISQKEEGVPIGGSEAHVNQ